MQRYLMNFSTTDCKEIKADCLVIGAGVAGMQTARKLSNAGRKVLVIVRDTVFDSNTNKAQGGIAASLGADDNAELHLKDTLIAGAGLSDEKISRLVVTEGAQDVAELYHSGAEFDKNADGTLSLGREGCHCRNRIVHAHGDATGAEVARSLHEIIKNDSNITIQEHTYAVDILTKDNRAYGVTALYNGEKIIILANHIILANGGCGRLFSITTNPEGATGSGIAMAYRAGAEVMDMEFVQFHPTALSIKGCPNFLISEAVRGAGAYLLNPAGERFMPNYHELLELAPRDVVARAIFTEMQKADSDNVFLDARHIENVAQKFPMIYETCLKYGLDMSKDLLPIAPASHYMMGGVKTDEWGRTNLANLYACGEVACTGLQGANRLASNSLLEGLVFGRRIAEIITQTTSNDTTPADIDLEWQENSLASNADLSHVHNDNGAVQKNMSRNFGICRDEEHLNAGLAYLKSIAEQYIGYESNCYEALDLRSRLTTGFLIAQAALRRKESRGAHYRKDFPNKDNSWLIHCTDAC